MVYFDNAATGMPKSEAVAKAMLDAHNNCGNSGRSGHIFALESAKTVYNCRKRLASMFGSTPENVVLTSGATEALNIAIKGTARYGGIALCSTLEHNSVMRPLNAARRSKKTVLKQFAVDVYDDEKTLTAFSYAAKGASTVVVTHASNVCGRILPVAEMRALAPDNAVFILDASQTAGHIQVDIRKLGVDILCIPGHKGLYGPMGTGALIINPERHIIIEPLCEGGTGANSKSLEMPDLLPERLEAGTQNICGIAGLSAAVAEFEMPTDERELFFYLISSLRKIDGIRLYGAPVDDDAQYVPVALFNMDNIDCEELCLRLNDYGFALRSGFHCAPNAHKALGSYDTGGLRISLGRGNTKSEIDGFLDALVLVRD